MRTPALVALLYLFNCINAHADLLLQLNDTPNSYSTSALLKRSDVKSISVPEDAAYKRTMRYQAIPLANLLRELGFETSDHLNFIALDGFVASIPAQIILAPAKAQAWLAIEPENQPWPALSADSKISAGPFYLVWLHSESDHISPEQWPYQIARIERVDAIAQRFPMLLPAQGSDATEAVQHGFVVFQKNCLACHKLNGGGESNIGPDLNIPHNPTEYFQLAFLKQLIRNPAQVRSWGNSKMPSFNTRAISEPELDALVAYLRHMAGTRTAGSGHEPSP